MKTQNVHIDYEGFSKCNQNSLSEVKVMDWGRWEFPPPPCWSSWSKLGGAKLARPHNSDLQGAHNDHPDLQGPHNNHADIPGPYNDHSDLEGRCES